MDEVPPGRGSDRKASDPAAVSRDSIPSLGFLNTGSSLELRYRSVFGCFLLVI